MAPRTDRSVSGPALVGLLALLTATAALSIDMYLPTMPALARIFHTDASRVQLTLSAFFIGFGLGQLVYGPLSDQLGRKGLLLLGMSIYALASLLCALAPSIEMLILFRFLEALGASAGPVLARAMVRDLYDREEGARVLSYIILALGFAPLLAPLIGGYVQAWVSWRLVFGILTAVGVGTFVLCLIVLPETLPPERRQKVHALELLRRYGRLLTSRAYLGYVITATCVYIGLYAYIAGSPFVFINVYGVAARHYGFLFGLNAIGLMAAAFINGRLVRRVGSKTLLRRGVIGSCVAGVAMIGAAVFDSSHLVVLLVPLFFFIASFCFVAPNAIAAALSVFPEIAGAASALSGAIQFWCGALASTSIGLLQNSTAIPMAAMIGGGTIASLIVYRILVHSKR